MRDLSTAIDHLAAEDPSEIPRAELAEQLLELHWQMARLQAQIARRTGVRHPRLPPLGEVRRPLDN
ncbi:hypothetical protein [Microtetraspora sp. NBRC 13810]|uniref:hypothetical protein n=1 Tax=Microtetraspora sp. NBRC 13810 TaxID=3030990 RepID=UPI00255365F4|nr:hypothetical protein [Microtetraspora sp. NBRC 13810]